MTVNASYAPDIYAGSGSTGPFVITFPFSSNADIDVTLIAADRTETTPTFNIVGTNLTVTSTAPAVGETLVISRSTGLTQLTDYPPNDPFPAASHEAALDKLTYIVQEQNENIDRAILLPIDSDLTGVVLPQPDAGKAIVWNDDEDGFVNSTVIVDDLADAVTDAETAAATATTKASEANASAIAAAASAAALNLPTPLTGQAGKSIKVKSDVSGYEFYTPSTVLVDGDYGDVTVSGTGTVMTVDNGAITYAKMQDVSAASRLLGRGSASGAGDPQEITLGTGFSMSGTTLNLTSSFTSSFESTEITVSTGNQQYAPQSHGLGGLPKIVQAILRCKSTSAGYSVDDEIDVTNSMLYNGVSTLGVSLWFNSTEVGASQINGISIPNKGTSAITTITYADWKLVFRAYR